MLTLHVLLDVVLLRGRIDAHALALLLGGHGGHYVVGIVRRDGGLAQLMQSRQQSMLTLHALVDRQC